MDVTNSRYLTGPTDPCAGNAATAPAATTDYSTWEFEWYEDLVWEYDSFDDEGGWGFWDWGYEEEYESKEEYFFYSSKYDACDNPYMYLVTNSDCTAVELLQDTMIDSLTDFSVLKWTISASSTRSRT